MFSEHNNQLFVSQCMYMHKYTAAMLKKHTAFRGWNR